MPQITEGSQVFHPDNTCDVTRTSAFSGKIHTMRIPATKEQFDKWHKGGLIQECFPWASADQREFILTGFTPEEWDAAFKDEDEDDG